jgi:hypothetical protein
MRELGVSLVSVRTSPLLYVAKHRLFYEAIICGDAGFQTPINA